MRCYLSLSINLLFILTLLLGSVGAQAYPEALIVNDEGGPVRLYGQLKYTNPLFTVGVAEPMILLEDQTGFVHRDRDFIIPSESQVLGRVTSDFLTSPFEYSLLLPTSPQATVHNFGLDANTDTGVMVYSLAYWTNTFGDAYLEQRDQYGGGWSTAYTSVRVYNDVARRGEIWGGRLLIYAPEPDQLFPLGFGDDGMLFTEDDPLMRVLQGYSVVNLDDEPFVLDRSREIRMDILEGSDAAVVDFSSLTYSEAFDQMLLKLRREYAFTDHKQINWDDLDETFRLRFEEAEANNDAQAYLLALRDFTWAIPDGHVDSNIANALFSLFIQETDGGIGLALRVTDDAGVIANFVLEDSPAAQANIARGAEIISWNGEPVLDVLARVRPWSGRFSTPHVDQLQQLRYLTRFEVDEVVTLTFRNQGSSVIEEAQLLAVPERASFEFSSFNLERSGFELPVAYQLLESGLLFVQISSFADDERLTIDLWERMLRTAIAQNVPGIIIDMRRNGGGSAWLADQMPAYFFDEVLELGNIGFYDEALDEFYFDPARAKRFYLPDESLRYDGPLAVLVGPDCSSACEFFSYNLSLQDRAVVLGQYPSGGLGGSIEQFYMPGQIIIQFTNGQAVNEQGQIHIEGSGVVPDVRVPVTIETLLGEQDAVLMAAESYLLERSGLRIVDAGMLAYDSLIEGVMQRGERLRYTVILPAESISVFVLTDPTGRLDTILRVLDPQEFAELAFNDDFATSVNSAILGFETGPQDRVVIIELGTFNDASGGEFSLRVAPMPVAEETDE